LSAEHGGEASADREKIRRVIQSVANEAETLKQLQDSPESLKERFHLTDAELDALRSGRLHIGIARMEVTFVNDMTITAQAR